jgi:phosphate ABC transporter permease subunit PstA
MATVDTTITRDIVADRSLSGRRIDWSGHAFRLVLLGALLITLAAIVLLLGTVLADGLPVFEERGFVVGDVPASFADTWSTLVSFVANPDGIAGWVVTLVVIIALPSVIIWLAARQAWKAMLWLIVGTLLVTGVAALIGTSDFLTSNLSRIPDRAGAAQAIFGTMVLTSITALVALPLGIATAVYLEEYAPPNRFTNFVRLNIRNLAGVPSVVYGLLGLAIFVNLLGNEASGIPLIGGLVDDVFGDGGITGGRTIVAGGLALSVLVLPIVIITSSEAMRAVPDSLREGAYGVGATKWEVTRFLVLPNAFAGILTGTILAVSRAVGETAPLILVGAFAGTFFTTGDATFFEKFDTTYTALPMVIYQWTTEPADEFKTNLAGAAILVLLGITFLANLTAVILRNRHEKRW